MCPPLLSYSTVVELQKMNLLHCSACFFLVRFSLWIHKQEKRKRGIKHTAGLKVELLPTAFPLYDAAHSPLSCCSYSSSDSPLLCDSRLLWPITAQRMLFWFIQKLSQKDFCCRTTAAPLMAYWLEPNQGESVNITFLLLLILLQTSVYIRWFCPS